MLSPTSRSLIKLDIACTNGLFEKLQESIQELEGKNNASINFLKDLPLYDLRKATPS
jgi:hypothetical protein